LGPQSSSSAAPEGAIFSNLGNGSFTSPNLTSSRGVSGLQFTSTAYAYTFTGNATVALTYNGTAGIVNNSSNAQTFNIIVSNSQASGSVSNTLAGGALVFNSGFNLSTSGTSRTVTLSGLGNITMAGVIANGGASTAGAVTVTSTGTTVFSGNNTYSGLTTMNAVGGVLTLSGNNSAAAGGVTLTNGTLNINHANAIGTGPLTLTAGTINNTSGAAVTNLGNQNWT